MTPPALLLVGACCTLAAFGSFLFGYDSGIISSIIVQDDFQRSLAPDGVSLSTTVVGGIVSSFTGGALIGTIAAAHISDRYGRRGAIFCGALLSILGGALQCGAVNIAMIIVGRVFCGLGVGIMAPSVPNFCLEISPPHLRGLLGGIQQWMIGLGIVSSQWIGYGSSLKSGAFSWRFPLGLQIIPGFILACAIYTVAESPRYLVVRGEDEAAESALALYRFGDSKGDKSQIQNELADIRSAVAHERSVCEHVSWHSLFKDASNLRSALLACSIQLFTQTSGINVIAYFGPLIYQRLGYTTTSALFIQGIYGALALLWNTVCLALVDKVGRRKLLIPSFLGMGCALCVSAALVQHFDPTSSENEDALRAVVAMNFVFSVFFTSLGVISWIFAGEIFPTSIRARGTSLSTAVNWSANLIFAQCSPLALSTLSQRYFYIFASFNFAATVIVWAFYPETQHAATLEAVTDHLPAPYSEAGSAYHNSPTTKRIGVAESGQEKGTSNN